MFSIGKKKKKKKKKDSMFIIVWGGWLDSAKLQVD